MDTKSFDEQVAALRGKVEPRRFHGKKSDATPEQWAADMDYGKRLRETDAGRAKNRERVRAWSKENSERARARRQKWIQDNPQRARDIRGRAWQAWSASGKFAAYKRQRRRSDLHYRLTAQLRCRLNDAVRGRRKSGSAVRDLGCSIDDLKAHLERQFAPGMTWENWGKGAGAWQIDHVYPLAKADLTDRAQLLAVCNWRNLQPLWETDNIRKGDTVTPDAQALFDRLRAEFSATAAA